MRQAEGHDDGSVPPRWSDVGSRFVDSSKIHSGIN